MRNRIKNFLIGGSLFILLLVAYGLTISPVYNNFLNKFYSENLKDMFMAIGSLIVTTLTLLGTIKLRKPILKPSIYCKDNFFVDRTTERKTLFSFLTTENAEGNTLFFVKGSMCRGKTALLQYFADEVNKNSELQKEYPKSKEYSAYYVAISQSSDNILSEISASLSISETINTCDQLYKFLKATRYRKKVLLIIDNVSRNQKSQVIEVANSLLYDNSLHLKIILGITENVTNSRTNILEPPLFGEIQVMELAQRYRRNISDKEKGDIVRISNGIPSYIRIIFDAQLSGTNLSNIEDIQGAVQEQLNYLTADNKIAAYLACLNLCYDSAIAKDELLALAEASQNQLEEVLNAALASETMSRKDTFISMDSLVAKCCRNTIYCPMYFLKIYEFYKQLNPNSDIAFISLFLLTDVTAQQQITIDLLEKKYAEKKFLLFAKLGELEQEENIPIFHENYDLYNNFRYFYLSSLLELGEYVLAIDKLKQYENSEQNLPSLRTSYTASQFKMQYLIINLHHLSNQFVLALWEMETILSQATAIQLDHRSELLYLKAHCLKHVGSQLKEADNILKELEKNKLHSQSLYIKVLASRMAIHLFWGDSAYDYKTTLLYLKSLPQNKLPEQLHAVRHIAHYAWKEKNNVNEALTIIDSGLDILEVRRWRIIYDFYFEKAEWLRIQNAESASIVNDISTILCFYEKAITFGEENMDNNLACCARLGKILTLFPEHGHSETWCAEQIKIVDHEYMVMEEAHLEINRAYALYVKTLLSKERPSHKFIQYCVECDYYDLVQHMEKGKPLKLTVM